MTPRRAVDFRQRAAVDLAAAAARIARSMSHTAAVRWRNRIEAAINDLSGDAGSWPEADEAADLGINLRCRLFGRRQQVYRILFMIEDGTQTVHVLRVRHAAQDRLSASDI